MYKSTNIKVLPKSRPVCAEPIALGAALQDDWIKIIGMIVVGDPQEDSFSKKTCSTLHPCHECRILMASHPLMEGSTRIVTAVLTDPPAVYEIHTLRQLLALHGEDETLLRRDSRDMDSPSSAKA